MSHEARVESLLQQFLCLMCAGLDSVQMKTTVCIMIHCTTTMTTTTTMTLTSIDTSVTIATIKIMTTTKTTRLRAVVLFSSDQARKVMEKITQITKVNEEGLWRGRKTFLTTLAAR